MKRSKFTEAQIAFILRQAEEGTVVGEVCRKAGISEATYYNWRKKYAGSMPSEMKRLRQLEHRRDRQTTARLCGVLRPLGKPANLIDRIVRSRRNGLARGNPPSVCKLESPRS